MADFISHDLLGEQALSVFPAAAQRAAALHPAAFRWGLQGPDPLFYHKVYEGRPLYHIGVRLHQEKTDELFTVFSEAVNRLTETAHEIAAAYFYGFLCHYALDSTLHPYVYYRLHEYLEAIPHEKPDAIHGQIENDIDRALFDKLKGCRLRLPFEQYHLTDEETAVLAVLLHHLIRRVLREYVPTNELRPIFTETIAVQRMFLKGGQMLGTSVRFLERVFDKNTQIPEHVKAGLPQWDALNESHTPWRNLWEPDIVCTDSVLDLFDFATDKAAELASSYAAQFDSGWMLNLSYYESFDYGNFQRTAP